VGQLIGAAIAVGVLSRLLFASTKNWPHSTWKIFFINILSALLSISWAIIGHAVSAGGVLGQVGRIFVVYGAAHALSSQSTFYAIALELKARNVYKLASSRIFE
jgi:uncharacterized membrane protein